MFSKVALRSKLLLLLLVPLVAIVALAALRAASALSLANDAADQSAEIRRALELEDLVFEFDREIVVLLDRDKSAEELAQFREAVDEKFENVLADPGTISAEDITAIREAQQQIVPELRAIFGSDPLTFQSRIEVQRLIDDSELTDRLDQWAQTGDRLREAVKFDAQLFVAPELYSEANTLLLANSVSDALAAEQLAYVTIAERRASRVTIELIEAGVRRGIEAESTRSNLERYADQELVEPIASFFESNEYAVVAQLREDVRLLEPGVALEMGPVDIDRNIEAATEILDLTVEEWEADALATSTGQRDAAQRSASITIGALLALIIATIALSYAFYRSIRRPLQKVTARSHEVATVELPAVLELMRSDLDAELPHVAPIEVHTNDEVGDLVGAFNELSTTAVSLAGEQAASRRAAGDMFMNLGRRNQKLLNRMLRSLSKLERDERDPQTLESLYVVDQLATRMRRNAESLLVLAGAEQTRKFSKPSSLGDIVRSAMAEVEEFHRINVVGDVDSMVAGPFTADLGHLIAELAENALTFSPPTSNVQIAIVNNARALQVVVTDRGVGMTEEKMDALNQRIVDAGTLSETPSKFLGLFVAGRLAARRGFTVTLHENPVGGTTARVVLPPEAAADTGSNPSTALASAPRPTDTAHPTPQLVVTAPAEVRPQASPIPRTAPAGDPLMDAPPADAAPAAAPPAAAPPAAAPPMAAPAVTPPTVAPPRSTPPAVVASAVAAETTTAFGTIRREPGASRPDTHRQTSTASVEAAVEQVDSDVVRRNLSGFQASTTKADRERDAR